MILKGAAHCARHKGDRPHTLAGIFQQHHTAKPILGVAEKGFEELFKGFVEGTGEGNGLEGPFSKVQEPLSGDIPGHEANKHNDQQGNCKANQQIEQVSDERIKVVKGINLFRDAG